MTLVIDKYTYPKLEREMISGVRHYTDGDSPVPSVTTILSETGDKTALFEWRKRVGDAEANRISIAHSLTPFKQGSLVSCL